MGVGPAGGDLPRGRRDSSRRPGDEDRAITATFEAMPLEHEASRARAAALIDQYRPKVVLAIERLGPNRKGVTHGATGISRDPEQSKTQYLFEHAAARNIATIGIRRTASNEIGFGLIADDVRRVLGDADQCQCPCQGGTACQVATDVLVVAAISNWGGYGVAANLAYQLEKPELLIDADTVERMLTNCVEAGAVDGLSNLPILSDDGVPLLAHRACIDILTTFISIASSTVDDLAPSRRPRPAPASAGQPLSPLDASGRAAPTSKELAAVIDLHSAGVTLIGSACSSTRRSTHAYGSSAYTRSPEDRCPFGCPPASRPASIARSKRSSRSSPSAR